MENFERYKRNVETFSLEELTEISEKRICVVGCGGLGGYVIQTLARFGVESLTLVDGEVFNATHLNRQVFAEEFTLGFNKAEAAANALLTINPEVEVEAIPRKLVASNAKSILEEHDLVMDCLDCISTKFILAEICAELKIPIIHGEVAGFYGQVANIYPGSNLLLTIYPNKEKRTGGLEAKLGAPSFTPLVVAGIQCSEALKLLAGRQNVLHDEVLRVDLYNNQFESICFN